MVTVQQQHLDVMWHSFNTYVCVLIFNFNVLLVVSGTGLKCMSFQNNAL